ncbi:RidA family protein [Tsuneonella sp. YG55]|uniref:RidA family protein n=1 Tax=Tsuneonella litorea TaxID=2976475 RepID=A0A9X2W305_9SPHN|nr:RidA family protein [Tsuneonella litorea]MCT2559284.1 RidA family protein [Tsuneonella litorea]
MQQAIRGFILVVGAAAALWSLPAMAQVTRAGPEGSPIAASVTIPPGATVVNLSGALASEADPSAPEGSVERYGDTEVQTRSVLRKLAAGLAAQGMGPEDVVMMRVYLVAPPGSDRMDFGGMMKAYREMFGTAGQPNKPARVTVQVAALAAPQFLVEIEVQAAKVMDR